MIKKSVGVLLFDGFEILDAYGPIEMFGMYPDNYEITVVADTAAPVASSPGIRTVPDRVIPDTPDLDILLVPGGAGTRREIRNQPLLNWLRKTGESCQIVASVCTGSVLLARSGLLASRRATTNKNAFNWAREMAPEVSWVPIARWVVDGNIYTSSGVSAGIDMTLALIADDMGIEAAEQAANWAEYIWNRDPEQDPFAKRAGLV